MRAALTGLIAAALGLFVGCSSDSGQQPDVGPSTVALTAAAFTITGTVDLETGDNCYQLDTRTSEQSSDESKCVYWTTYYPLFLAANATAQDGTSYIVMWLDPQVDIVSAAEWGSYRDASGWTVFTAAQPPPSAMHLSARVEGQLVECEVGAMLACDEA